MGFSQEILPGWHASVDGYMKLAHNMIDEGQFGSPVLLSVFNYRRGQVHGYEFATDYTRGPLSIYGNFAWSAPLAKILRPLSGTLIRMIWRISKSTGYILTMTSAGRLQQVEATRFSIVRVILCASPQQWFTVVDCARTVRHRMALPCLNM